MILTCPECETRYRVDAADFPTAGRKVRCAKCAHVWHQSATEPEALSAAALLDAPPSDSAVALAAADPAAKQVRRARSRPWAERVGIIAGWAGLAAIIFVIGWMGLRFRQEVATLWPQSSSLYATFGFASNTHAMAITDWTYRWETQNGQSVVVVTGKLVNMSSRELSVPPVRVTLTDDGQRELYHWTFRPPQPTLGPGQNLSFLTRLSSPPPGTRHLQLRFASQD